MREIEFRGKIKFGEDKGMWVYGYLYVYNEPKIYSILNENNVIELNQYGTNVPAFINVDPKTIGQYTGLKDKNGREIYEGDIVKSTYKEKRNFYGVNYVDEMTFIEEVVWSSDYNGWCLKIVDEGINLYRRFNYCEEINNIKLDNVEVIGNRWDNPELLEDRDD